MKQEIQSGIYQIKNLINGKFYIGSSNDCHQRWIEHLSDLRRNKHHSIHLQNAWNKYGEENFIHEIIEIVDIDILLKREQFWLDELKPYDKEIGYNICSTAGKLNGYKHTEETKQFLSKLSKGLKRTDETRKRMSENHSKYWLGEKRSEEFKENLKIKNTGEDNPHYGKNHTEEALLKMRKVVYQYDSFYNLIKIWKSVSSVKEYNFDPSSVAKYCNGKIKYYKNYIWSYVELKGDEMDA